MIESHDVSIRPSFVGNCLGIIKFHRYKCVTGRIFAVRQGRQGWQAFFGDDRMEFLRCLGVSVKFLVHKLWRFVVDQEIIGLIPFSFFAVVFLWGGFDLVPTFFRNLDPISSLKSCNISTERAAWMVEFQQAPSEPIW